MKKENDLVKLFPNDPVETGKMDAAKGLKVHPGGNASINRNIHLAKDHLLNREKDFLNNLAELSLDVDRLIMNWRRIYRSGALNSYSPTARAKQFSLELNKSQESKNKVKKRLMKSKEDAEVKLRFFKDQNDLMRDAKYPDSKMFYFAITALLILIETILNSEGHRGSGGLLEGFYVAFGISATNVIISICLGRGFTFKNLKKKYLQNGIAYSCLAGFIISSIFLNGFYATYRSVLESTQTVPPLIDIVQKTLDIFTLNYPFSDLKSHITFIMTLLFSIGAFAEGYFWSDPVPGHEALDRVLKDLQAQIDDIEVEISDSEKQLREMFHLDYVNSIKEVKDLSPGVGEEIITKLSNLIDHAKITEESVILRMNDWTASYLNSFQVIDNSRIETTLFQNLINQHLKYSRLLSRIDELKLRLVHEINSISTIYDEHLKTLEMNHLEFLTEIDSKGGLDEDEQKMVTLNPMQKLESQINDFQ